MKYIGEKKNWEEAFSTAQEMWNAGHITHIGQKSLTEFNSRNACGGAGGPIESGNNEEFQSLCSICQLMYPYVVTVHLFLIEDESNLGPYILLMMVYALEGQELKDRVF